MVSFGGVCPEKDSGNDIVNGACAGDWFLDGAFTRGGNGRSGDQAISAFQLDLCIGLRDRVPNWSGLTPK